MKRQLLLFKFALGLVASFALRVTLAGAQAQPLRVFVHGSAPEEHAVERLLAELRSDGFDAQPVAPGEPSPCALATPPATPDAARTAAPFACIELGRDESGDQLVAHVYHVPVPERATVTALVEQSDRLALAAVEALNGLTASPPRALPARSEAPAPPRPPQPVPARASLNLGALLILQALGGRPLAGASIGIEHALRPNAAFGLEVFIPALASSADGPDRELATSVAWTRLGARAHTSLPWLKLGAALQGGMSLIWARARSRDPALVGGVELSTAAIVSGGLWLESPGHSPLYVRASVQASRLLPSARVQLGGDQEQRFGDLFTELGLGVGLTWPR